MEFLRGIETAPLELYALLLLALTGMFVVLKSIRMPRSFEDNRALRQKLKQGYFDELAANPHFDIPEEVPEEEENEMAGPSPGDQ